MAFKKGQSGNPGGRSQERHWADALRQIANREGPDGRRRLLRLAEQCFDMAEAGDMGAIREIGDRIDGKALQESTVNFRNQRAAELGDDELADIAVGSGEGTATPPLDSSQLN